MTKAFLLALVPCFALSGACAVTPASDQEALASPTEDALIRIVTRCGIVYPVVGTRNELEWVDDANTTFALAFSDTFDETSVLTNVRSSRVAPRYCFRGAALRVAGKLAFHVHEIAPSDDEPTSCTSSLRDVTGMCRYGDASSFSQCQLLLDEVNRDIEAFGGTRMRMAACATERRGFSCWARPTGSIHASPRPNFVCTYPWPI